MFTMKGVKLVRGNKAGLEQLNDRHAKITKKYEEQMNIVNKIVAISSEYTGPLAHLKHVINKLDGLVSLALAEQADQVEAGKINFTRDFLTNLFFSDNFPCVCFDLRGEVVFAVITAAWGL